MNPLHLLKIEWSKFAPNGTFRVFMALYFGLFAAIVFLARTTGANMSMETNGAVSHPLARAFDYPDNWLLVGWMGSWANAFMLGSLGVFMITMEFSNRTLRQSVIFGLTRLEVAVSKLLWAAVIALAATLFYLLLGLGGELMDGKGAPLPPGGSLVGFFLQALGFLLLGNVVGLLIRQTALAVLAYLAYVLFLETIFRWILYFTVAKTRMLMFLPDQALGALTPLHMPDSVNELLNSSPGTIPLTATEAGLTVLVYVALFGALFCRRIAKADL